MEAKGEQREIIKFLSNEGTTAFEIHYRLRRAFQKDAFSLSSVYDWTRAFKSGRTRVLDSHWAGGPRLDHIDSKILSLFQQNEFHSARTLAKELAVSLGIVYSRFTDLLRLSLGYTRHASLFLTKGLNATRVKTSIEPLEILQ
jgi:transposase